jgi:hypothetical protein
MRGLGVVVIATLACSTAGPSRTTALLDPAIRDPNDARGRLARELEAEVRASYQRPTLDAAAAAAVIDPSVGLVAIGVGPEDLAVGLAPTTRWPVERVGALSTSVVPRAIEVHVATDETLGWAYDEPTLELPVCGRVATIPLRVFQVYARDNDRWTLIAEHVAYPQAMGRWLDAAVGPDGHRLPDAARATPATRIEQQSGAMQARDALTQAVSPDGDRAATWDASPSALAVWPDPLHVLRGTATRLGPSLAATVDAEAITLEGLRLALGPSRHTAVASATLLARIARGASPVEVRLRATFVLEELSDRTHEWRVRAAMVSVPITAGALVGRVVGVAAATPRDGVVAVTCVE